MRIAVIILTLGLILWGLSSVLSGTGEQATILDEPIPVGQPENLDISRAACTLKKHNDTLGGFWSGYADGIRTVTYFDPEAICGSPAYPYEIQDFAFTLVDAGGYQWPVTVDVVIYDAQLTDAPCNAPGEELCRYTLTCDEATFSFPNVGLVSFGSPCCVNRPFYIGLEYNDPGAGPFPSVAFDTKVPTDTCDNYQFYSDATWYEWADFWSPPGPGNPIFWVYGETESVVCQDQEAIIYTLETLHDNYETLLGTRVSVMGYYSGAEDNMLVSDFSEYLADEPMSPKGEMLFTTDTLADSMDLALVVATGYLLAEADPFPYYVDDTVTLKMYVNTVDKILEPAPVPSEAFEEGYFDQRDVDLVCDSCKFAILISGGVNATNNHARYWNNLAMLYQHKITNENYCPGNIKVLYYKGTSKNTAQIPQANVDSCTQAEIEKAHNEIASKIAACSAAGKKSTLQKLVTNHGSPSGINLLGNNKLDGGTFRSYQQRCIDSCCAFLFDEMVQCYGGNEADSMKTIDDKDKTEIHVNSAAGNVVHYSTATFATFLKTKIDSLAAGHTYDQSVAWAAEAYQHHLDSLIQAWEAWITNARAWLMANPPTGTLADTLRNRVIRDTLNNRNRIANTTAGQNSSQGRSNIWVRHQMKSYCQWKQIIVPKGGQLCLEFDGIFVHCGNVTVYKDSVDGEHVLKNKVAVWNWNIPGSPGYQSGNEKRYINGDTAQSTSFWIHNDDGSYTLSAQVRTDRPDPESPSNPDEFAGWSLGGTDSRSGEVGQIQTEIVEMNLVNQPGVMLNNMPQLLGGCGTPIVEANHFIPYTTPWHAAMEVRVVVNNVLNPGPLNIFVSHASNPSGTVNITAPGVYTFDCGSIAISNPSGDLQTVQLDAGFTGGCFEIDSWALRSTALDVSGCCDMPGDFTNDGTVDIGDLTATVDYMFAGGAGPVCFEEGDMNGDCSLDITDLTYRVDWMFGGGPGPVECHVCTGTR